MADIAYPYAQYSQPESRFSWRKLLVIAIALIVVIFGLFQLYEYLTLGQLVVRTGSNNDISVTTVSEQSVKKASGSLNMRLHAGQYLVTVAGQSMASSQVVSVKAHTTTTLNISPAKTTAVEPVTDTNAVDIAASGSRLYFLNSSGKLCVIDANNNQSVANNSVVFRNINWAGSNFGVGEDSNGNLYTINEGVVQPLPTDSLATSQQTKFAVAPNKTIYLSQGSLVYSNQDGHFQKIYSAPGEVTLLVPSNNGVLAVSSPDIQGDTKNHQVNASGMAFISTTGQINRSASTTFTAAVSGDGKYIAAAASAGGQIMDSSFHLLATIPSASFMNPRWLNNTELVYSLRDQLWRYDVSHKTAQLIANMPDGGTINELDLSDDGSYVYVGAGHINNVPVIKRVPLAGQGVSQTALQLQNIMPYTGANYFMSLVNFTRTTVLVTPLPPLTSTNVQYIQEAKSQLQSMDIDTASLDIRMSS